MISDAKSRVEAYAKISSQSRTNSPDRQSLGRVSMGSANRLSETRSMAHLRNYLTGPVRKSLIEDIGKAAIKEARKKKK